MFRIDRDKNEVVQLNEKRFTDLKFREREHLQVWIEKYPEILGEELLIIQKEFDGWDETKERLDLLAIDKKGRLVIIENKLDDSGRDVVWQALKYAAYCSTLNNDSIIKMFEKYLLTKGDAEPAVDQILDFLDVGSVEELQLNESASQRIILTAANFRPEVTATCLWLIGNDIQIHCIEVKPFEDGPKLYLSAERIIPPPAAEDFMVKVGKKEKSDTIKSAAATEWKLKRQEFFESLLSNLTGLAAKIYENRTPNTDHWLSGATGTSGVRYTFIFLKTHIRVNLTMDGSNTAENKWMFDKLSEVSNAINQDFKGDLVWMRLNHKKSSRIKVEKEMDMTDLENWPNAFEWMNKNMNEFVRVFQPYIDRVVKDPEFHQISKQNPNPLSSSNP